MGAPRKAKLKEQDLKGFKHFKLTLRMLERLHGHRCERDRGHNRKLHYDQHIALLLLYFFNPIITSLRGIQQASNLKKVQRILGCPRASLGSLSEAAHVFDAQLLEGIIGELTKELGPINPNSSFNDLQHVITLVDGSFLRALPQIAGAMFQRDHAGFKLHAHFELLKGVPTRADLTSANTSERAVLKEALQPGRLYVMDRGYLEFDLFKQITEIGSTFVCRAADNLVFEGAEVSQKNVEDAEYGDVVFDEIVQCNGKAAKKVGFDQPLRVIRVKCKPHRRPSGKNGRGGPEQGETLLIVTNLLDVPAAIIAMLYKHRWAVETFFRFFKHILGCRHLISHSKNGVQIQVYAGIIACLLIALWSNKKPTLRTYEMMCFYFSGLADLKELQAHIQKLEPAV